MNRKHNELSQKLEKSIDLPRDEFISINHELSNLEEKYDCYKKYLVAIFIDFDLLENNKRNKRSK